jgi:FixJ family two-component response regulator
MAMDVGTRVLVVEDDDSMRKAIERLLNATGLATAVYRSAEELLAVGPVEGDACVISDFKLPAMSGLELLAQLRARSWKGPLIMITAHDSPNLRKEAEDGGVAGYLTKPFLGSDLMAVIRKAIDRVL